MPDDALFAFNSASDKTDDQMTSVFMHDMGDGEKKTIKKIRYYKGGDQKNEVEMELNDGDVTGGFDFLL